MAYIARTDGSIEALDHKALTLEAAQKIVGGYVEALRIATPQGKFVILMDEEGKLKMNRVNAHAVDLCRGTHLIVGDVIVLAAKEARKW